MGVLCGRMKNIGRPRLCSLPEELCLASLTGPLGTHTQHTFASALDPGLSQKETVVEETPAESSEDELVAPSQVTARVDLKLVAAALDFSYSLGQVSKIPFSGPWARSCLGDALSRMEPQLLPWGLGKRCR